MKYIPKNLRLALGARGMTVAQLAAITGLTRHQVDALLYGRSANLEILHKITDALEIRIDDLLDEQIAFQPQRRILNAEDQLKDQAVDQFHNLNWNVGLHTKVPKRDRSKEAQESSPIISQEAKATEVSEELFQKVSKSIFDRLKQVERTASLDQLLSLLNEAYKYCDSRGDKKVDKAFIEWLIERML